ncbi:uncharacterized protein Plekhm1 [Prorops nasuta]|uniref:uncharacterized protein Plekhm1 n=1 Tax=Prorops nasuta TaxID=863751 RepID=UPI0034CE3BAA
MYSFLKTMNSMSSRRNAMVREYLQKQLNTVVMEMEGAQKDAESGAVQNCEETMALCSVLEAIFLHGLKDSILNQVTEVLKGPDFIAMPQPNFWGPLMVFSHRQTIDQIQALTQVSTEVGYCRAWIRVTLNEGILANYFSSLRRDNSALKPYYNRFAFIRDLDLIEIAERLIESLEYIHFDLACNSSLLNCWSTTPLMMAGIWTPPLKTCPIFSAIDIAKTITNDIPISSMKDTIDTASSVGSFGSFASSQSALNNMAYFTEDETFKSMLNAIPSTSNVQTLKDTIVENGARRNETQENLHSEGLRNYAGVDGSLQIHASTSISNAENESDKKLESANDANDTDAVTKTVGNSLFNKLGWSTSFEDGDLNSSMISQNSTDTPRTPNDGPTYDALIQSYHRAGNSDISDMHEFLKTYLKVEPIAEKKKSESSTNVTESAELNLDDQLGKLPIEKGLDLQNYSCLECGSAIGMTFSKAHVCSFTGDYYCINCMAQEEYLIPSRMIHNWDLKQYTVSRRSAEYLKNCSALLDLKVINPRIYQAVDTMAQLQSLRVQLNLLRAYLFTCREPIIESLHQKVTPRDYLYEHIHQYSIKDLLDINNGILAQQLQKVIEFAKCHVINCWLCSQKGFICEVCNNPKVIYPFEVGSTYRCGICNAVFHSTCLNAKMPCPKCERKRKRTDLPLLDIGYSEPLEEIATSSVVNVN